MDTWKTIKSEYIYKTPFGHCKRDTCELPNGVTIPSYYVHEYPNWVNAFVLTKELEVLLVKQYRYPGNDFFLEVPAGKVEEHESFEEAILRELKEETGYTSLVNPILMGQFMVNPAVQTNKIISYLIVDAYKVGEQDLDDNEDIDLHLVNLNQIEKLIKEGIITQYFTVSSYYMAKSYLNNINIKKGEL